MGAIDINTNSRKGVKAVIHKEGKFLLQLRDNIPSISYPNCWALFGGGVDEGESLVEALHRELDEELSWSPKGFKYLNEVENRLHRCYITHYLAEYEVGSGQLRLGEGSDMKWFTVSEIAQLKNRPSGVYRAVQIAVSLISG